MSNQPIAALDPQPASRASDPDALIERWLGDRALLEHVPYVVCLTDRAHRILFINRTVPGRQAQEFIGESVFDAMPLTERRHVQEALDLAWASGEPQTYTLHTLSNFWWEARAVPIKEHGRVVMLFLTCLDVTQRVLAEEALRESEARLRQTLEATGVGTFTWDAKADVVSWDGPLCGLWGGDPSQAPRCYAEYLACIHVDDRERVGRACRRHLSSGIFDEIEFRLLRADGDIRHVLAKAMPMRDTQGAVFGVRGLMFDITDRKRLDEHLRHAQKMEAIGQLTAGIAHNFNNLLSVILPNVGLCLDRTHGEVQQRLEDVQHAARRAAELVHQLMLFARSEVRPPKAALCLVALCRRTLDICRQTFPAAIEITLEARQPQLWVHGHGVQLEQVLLNVCLNARDALLEANTVRPRIRLCVGPDEAGTRAHISVEDNGPGMEESVALRVFEPFFTTKDAGRGTGLGLASAYAVLREHAGSILCESRPGCGARFEIDLPLSLERPPATPPVLAEPSVLPGRGTVLLIDDEAMVRRALRGILERSGYAVLEAAGGEEGIGVVERYGAHIDALLLDQSMPGLRGTQVVERLASQGCTLPVILMSGAPVEKNVTGATILHKPMQSHELLDALANALRGRGLPH